MNQLKKSLFSSPSSKFHFDFSFPGLAQCLAFPNYYCESLAWKIWLEHLNWNWPAIDLSK